MTTVKIVSNAYADYVAFIGRERYISFGTEWEAKQWLVEMVAKGYVLSKVSKVTAEDVEAHRKATQ